jgi:uncharacterized protein (TIGR03000 family)
MRNLLIGLLALFFVSLPIESRLAVPLYAQSASAQATASGALVRSQMTVTVPDGDAELTVEGSAIAGSGASRTFETAPLKGGTTYKYTISTTWKPNTYTTMTRTRVVSFRAGDPVKVDLSADDPTDRVRVIYVPTPNDIADEMVKLAGVTKNDVVFEPGCGDARITIAAVKAGARRGVGIDIDPDRVADSRERVKAAGLADRIEIRLGDALDIKDLSTGTVVLLYMGDHFNMLIRPHLIRELKVGSRIVSHRFLMGDWKPDKTISVSSVENGGDFELHLWTVTEEVKRRLR